jgi:hypothetical protein
MNVDIPSSEFDFEEFDGILSFRKKDNNTLIGYLPNNMAIELKKQ